MIGAFVFHVVSVIPAIFIAERIAKRRRRARWGCKVAVLPPMMNSMLRLARSRNAVACSNQIRWHPCCVADLRSHPNRGVGRNRELEAVGDGSHPEIIDYFTDLSFVEEPRNESILVNMRDLVIEFGSQLDQVVADSKHT